MSLGIRERVNALVKARGTSYKRVYNDKNKNDRRVKFYNIPDLESVRDMAGTLALHGYDVYSVTNDRGIHSLTVKLGKNVTR